MHRRALIAIVAAYALALQALIAAFAVPAFALPGNETTFPICRTGGTTDRAPMPEGDRTSHTSCMACLAGHCGGANCDRTARATIVPVLVAAVARLQVAVADVVRASSERPPAARGPPAARA